MFGMDLELKGAVEFGSAMLLGHMFYLAYG